VAVAEKGGPATETSTSESEALEKAAGLDAEETALAQRARDLYAEHHPAQLGRFADIMQRDQGRLADLVRSLGDKYVRGDASVGNTVRLGTNTYKLVAEVDSDSEDMPVLWQAQALRRDGTVDRAQSEIGYVSCPRPGLYRLHPIKTLGDKAHRRLAGRLLSLLRHGQLDGKAAPATFLVDAKGWADVEAVRCLLGEGGSAALLGVVRSSVDSTGERHFEFSQEVGKFHVRAARRP
jgi:hypothetical protein